MFCSKSKHKKEITTEVIYINQKKRALRYKGTVCLAARWL